MWHLKCVSAPAVMKKIKPNELSNDKVTYPKPFPTFRQLFSIPNFNSASISH